MSTSEERHTQDRDAIIARLQAAGWELTETGDLAGVANLTYDNGNLSLEVDHTRGKDKRSMNVVFIRPDGDEVMILVRFNDDLEEVLRVLVEHQDKVTPPTAKKVLDDLMRVCPGRVLTYDGDEVVEIVDGEA
jgi:hypothetical protein